MSVQRTLVSLAAAAVLVQLSMAANYTVGGPNGGWDMATDLKTWATSQKFAVGDSLVFQYLSSHDVSEVPQADYDSCQASNAVQTYSDGNTEILLTSPGKRYFICGVPGHCLAGMKVEIDTLAATSPAPPSPSGPPQASPVAPAPQVSPSTPPPTSSPAPETSSPSPSIASPTPEASSPSPSPASPAPEASSPSPSPAPEAFSPSPVESPTSAPTLSPVPSSSPSSSPPPSPDTPASESPSTSIPPVADASPPQPSSAVKGVFKTTLAMGFIFGIIPLVAF